MNYEEVTTTDVEMKRNGPSITPPTRVDRVVLRAGTERTKKKTSLTGDDGPAKSWMLTII